MKPHAILFFAGIGLFVFGGSVKAQSSCDTLQECAQLALDAAQAAKELVERFMPKDSVVAFALDKCPPGPWAPYEPAYGKFVRGIDKARSRRPGNIQEEQVGSHAHSYARITEFFGAPNQHDAKGWEAVPKQGATTRFSGEGGDGKNQFQSGVKSELEETELQASNLETRPKNVALLYCIRK